VNASERAKPLYTGSHACAANCPKNAVPRHNPTPRLVSLQWSPPAHAPCGRHARRLSTARAVAFARCQLSSSSRRLSDPRPRACEQRRYFQQSVSRTEILRCNALGISARGSPMPVHYGSLNLFAPKSSRQSAVRRIPSGVARHIVVFARILRGPFELASPCATQIPPQPSHSENRWDLRETEVRTRLVFPLLALSNTNTTPRVETVVAARTRPR